jgi:hypothetical protein
VIQEKDKKDERREETKIRNNPLFGEKWETQRGLNMQPMIDRH